MRGTRARSSHRMYYWLVCVDDEGKRYLVFGSDRDADDARAKGFEMGLSDFEIKRFPTREINSASHMLRHGIVKATRDIQQAGKRLGHEKSIRRKFGRTPSQEAQDGRGIFG